MTPLVHRILGAGAAVASVLLLAALTRAPYRVASEDEARVRLSWRIRSEQVGACVPPSEEELEQLPSHMRNPEACVGDVPPFRLRVRVDGRTAVDQEVRAGGVRGDRPVYVLREVPVEPGAHSLRVSFEQQDPADGPTGSGDALRLELEARIQLDARDVVLVTLDPQSRSLVLRR